MTLFAVGDVQGCAREFSKLLKKISFDRRHDQLWLVGDLVNRGPGSAKVLRTVMELGDSATCVLGNHDLHLLAAAAGARIPSATDTFHDVLDARDSKQLLDWLRRQPLLHLDKERRLALVHAGIPPGWRMKQARKRAAEVEAMLGGRNWRKSLRSMYGNAPDRWDPRLPIGDRRRFTINALTRMRFCDANGRLDFNYSCAPGFQPKWLTPWFEARGRRGKKWHVVFGHWSALGILLGERLTAVDTGCVWGNSLTAVPLDPLGDPVAVSCSP
jgi:bis(5'-nucleosyl)-tetraphosphatase (symmetrical)